MKKFSRIIENIENEKFYKVNATIELILPAENEGEAGYLADSVLAGIEYTSNYTIELIGETEERIQENVEQEFLKGKDASYLVPHLIGNAIDALDSYIQLTINYIKNKDYDKALDILKNSDILIEKIKVIINDFRNEKYKNPLG